MQLALLFSFFPFVENFFPETSFPPLLLFPREVSSVPLSILKLKAHSSQIIPCCLGTLAANPVKSSVFIWILYLIPYFPPSYPFTLLPCLLTPDSFRLTHTVGKKELRVKALNPRPCPASRLLLDFPKKTSLKEGQQ